MKLFRTSKIVFQLLVFSMLIFSIFVSRNFSFADEKGNVFNLNAFTASQSGEVYTEQYQTGDTIFIKVEYSTPDKSQFDKAEEGEENFYIKINLGENSELLLIKASTIICANDMCRMSDEIDIFNFKNNTAQVGFGYDGYLLFETRVNADKDFEINVRIIYGNDIYEESDSISVEVMQNEAEEPQSTPIPNTTDAPADAPDAPDTPDTQDTTDTADAQDTTDTTNTPMPEMSDTPKLPSTGGISYKAISIITAFVGLDLGLGLGIHRKKS